MTDETAVDQNATATHHVIVQKDITLATGESLATYAQKVRDAGTKYVRQKLNLGTKSDCSCYPIEIFSKSVIFDVYQYGPNVNESDRCRYYAVAYARKDDGSFEFSTLTEVERVVGYQAKGTAAVTKAQWSAAEINNLPDAAFAVILPGGKKDASGKTTPRSLRMLPHHSSGVKSGAENGSVDLPHLRNALARLEQSKMPAGDKSKARAHLMAHAKELLPSEGGGDSKPTKKALEDAPGWTPTAKAFWHGVL